MQRWDVYISIKAKQKQPIQSVIIKSIEQNMSCVYEARVRILEFSSQSMRTDSVGFAVGGGAVGGGATNGKAGKFERSGELETSCETSLTSSLSPVSEVPSAVPNRSIKIPMSFSEDRIASKAGFTSSGTYTTMAGSSERMTSKASFTSSGTLTGGEGWDGGTAEGGGEIGGVPTPSSPPEITVEDDPGELHVFKHTHTHTAGFYAEGGGGGPWISLTYFPPPPPPPLSGFVSFSNNYNNFFQGGEMMGRALIINIHVYTCECGGK